MMKTSFLAAKSVETLLLRDFHKVRQTSIKKKSHFAGLVSHVDIAAEKIIKNIIRKKYPSHNILGEELGALKKKSDYTWLIDPLDGTHNYLMGNPIFCTAIALIYKNEVVLSVINAPFIKELYWGAKGKGAWLNNKRLRVSQKNIVSQSLFYYCHGYRKKDVIKALKIYAQLKMRANDVRQLGAASLETAWVAAGRAEGFVIPGGKPWDVAAGLLLVREAGGRATDFQNRDWRFNSKDMICSNGLIHDKFLKLIK
jgi:myo-inositol-1(or 4)-monophosphatase